MNFAGFQLGSGDFRFADLPLRRLRERIPSSKWTTDREVKRVLDDSRQADLVVSWFSESSGVSNHTEGPEQRRQGSSGAVPSEIAGFCQDGISIEAGEFQRA